MRTKPRGLMPIVFLLPVVFLSVYAADIVGVALAAPQDYRFVVVQPVVGLAHEALITVRLVHEPDGAAITDAIVTPRALKMPMRAMAPMAGRAGRAKADGKGEYTFTANINMEGDWLIQIEARVPGESEPVLGVVAIHAVGPPGPSRRLGPSGHDSRPEEQH